MKTALPPKWILKLLRNSVNYYQSVLDSMGAPGGLDASYRLFMVPGMGHCSGGDGPTSFDPIPAIEQWVERGEAPDRIVASRWVNGKVEAVTNTAKRMALSRAGLEAKQVPPLIWTDFEEAIKRNRAVVWRSAEGV